MAVICLMLFVTIGILTTGLSMKKSFEDYLPNEAKKIDKAVIIRCGSYLIACVTSDYEKAKDVITKAIKE